MTPQRPTAEEAIAAALTQDWKKAIFINTQLLKLQKTDVDALCRLAFAHLKSGQIAPAKRIYQKVLTIDEYNQIATKNLKKLVALSKKEIQGSTGSIMSPMIFLEEPGKTKIVECVHVAPPPVLSTLSAGQELYLKIRRHSVEVRIGDTYVAALPDDLSFKLIKMTSGGNTYQAILKSVDKNSVKVLIRELTRGKKFAKQPSFTSTTSYISFAKGGSTHESLDMTPTGEESDESEPTTEDLPQAEQ